MQGKAPVHVDINNPILSARVTKKTVKSKVEKHLPDVLSKNLLGDPSSSASNHVEATSSTGTNTIDKKNKKHPDKIIKSKVTADKSKLRKSIENFTGNPKTNINTETGFINTSISVSDEPWPIEPLQLTIPQKRDRNSRDAELENNYFRLRKKHDFEFYKNHVYKNDPQSTRKAMVNADFPPDDLEFKKVRLKVVKINKIKTSLNHISRIIPNTYKQAVASQMSKHWIPAIEKELSSHADLH